ncbi:MAG: fluoride efflux transporter CrcB [Myxococcales bacterium]|nr:fluoride efflux transporter CrcB [Myxococcota bacterium]MDW8282079.1 fluoride efflux transporter CrcB [Myxococcales bacterium]
MREVFSLAIAGALGTLSRWALSGWAYRLLGTRFPYGTLVVNVLGGLILGVIMEVGIASELLPRDLRLALSVGFCGAFTTFSTFSYETARYLEDGAMGIALLNIAANVVLCLLATFTGLAAGRALLGGL